MSQKTSHNTTTPVTLSLPLYAQYRAISSLTIKEFDSTERIFFHFFGNQTAEDDRTRLVVITNKD